MPATNPPAAGADGGRRRRRLPRPLALLVAVPVALLLAGCRVDVVVSADLARDGSGEVAVAVGLDQEAAARLAPGGDLAAAVRVEDLEAAGWAVDPVSADPDGTQWIRAHKAFAPGGFQATLDEVAPTGVLEGFALHQREGDGVTIYEVAGEVDLTGGLDRFADPELTAALDGQPFGGNVEAVEAEVGAPVADLVDVEVSVVVGDGAPVTAHPTLADPTPVPVVATDVVEHPSILPTVLFVAAVAVLGVGLAVLMLVRVRRRFGEVHPQP